MRECQPGGIERGLHRIDGALRHGAQVQRRVLQMNRAPRDARDVEQVVHQAREMQHLALDDGTRPLDCLVRRVAKPYHLGGGADRRQRIAQFMRQRRQELVLLAVGFAQLFVGGVQRLFGKPHVSDVMRDMAGAVDMPVDVDQGKTGVEMVQCAAVEWDDLFGLDGLPGLHHFHVVLAQHIGIGCGHQVVHCQAAYRLPAHAQDLLHLVVHVQEAAVDVLEGNHGGKVVHGALQQLLPFAQRLLGMDAVRDIHLRHDAANHLTVSAENWRRRQHGEQPLVRPAERLDLDEVMAGFTLQRARQAPFMRQYPLSVPCRPISPPALPFAIAADTFRKWRRAPDIFGGLIHAHYFAFNVGHDDAGGHCVEGGIEHTTLGLRRFGSADGLLAAGVERGHGKHPVRHVHPAGHQGRDLSIALAQRADLEINRQNHSGTLHFDVEARGFAG